MTSGRELAEASLKQNGKTFHWARRFLGQEMGGDAAMLYSFCRILDDMADGDIEGGPKRLKVIYKDLKAKRAIKDADLASFHPFIEKHNLPRDVALALIDGLLMDQKPVAVQDEAEVIRYGYHVAGTVGVLMCSILTLKPFETDRVIHPAHFHAIDMGVGMQLTNIARDVLEDAKMGRRYLPASWVEGMSAQDICDAAERGDEQSIAILQRAIQKLLGVAERFYESGIIGLNYLPPRAHLAILIAGKTYRQIGIQLARGGTMWHQGRVVTSTPTKAITSLMALPQIAERLKEIPPHNAALHLPLQGLPHVHE